MMTTFDSQDITYFKQNSARLKFIDMLVEGS